MVCISDEELTERIRSVSICQAQEAETKATEEAISEVTAAAEAVASPSGVSMAPLLKGLQLCSKRPFSSGGGWQRWQLLHIR